MPFLVLIPAAVTLIAAIVALVLLRAELRARRYHYVVTDDPNEALDIARLLYPHAREIHCCRARPNLFEVWKT